MKSLIIVALIMVGLVLGCKNTKKAEADLNPFKGSLAELLPNEFSSDGLKFKSLGSSAETPKNFADAKEAKFFGYMQEAGGIGVKIEGTLANYPSAELAQDKLRRLTKGADGISVVPDGKNLRVVDESGKSAAWTNGSLVCLISASAKKGLENFKNAAPF